MQGPQKLQSASVLLKASSEVSSMMQVVKQTGIDLDFEPPVSSLIESLSLAGKNNQSFNKLTRQLIKPSLPFKIVKLADYDGNSFKIHIWR